MTASPILEPPFDRALAAMLGVALGDAMGMPSQSMSRAELRRRYGRIGDFVDAAADQPVSRGLKAATVTDDTEQSVLLARHLIDGQGAFDQRRWAAALVDWDRDTRARGVNDLLGPSTRRAIEALARGVPPEETGCAGTTNGAAMRIVPVGIATPLEPLERFVACVEETCRLTHNTGVAIGAAAAVAAVVSAGLDGAGFEDAIALGLAAAWAGEARGRPATTDRIAERIEHALALAGTATGPEAIEAIATELGTGVAAIESVPTAFAVARFSGSDPWRAAILAANLGGDTDTIGAIACGMCAAANGVAALPADKVRRVVAVNRLAFEPLVEALLRLRRVRSAGRAP